MPATVGLIDFQVAGPLGVLSAYLDTAGPYSGQATITTINGNALSASSGVAVVVRGTIPAYLGYTDGWVAPTGLFDGVNYELRLWQAVVQHQLASGLYVNTQEVNSVKLGQIVLWANALPSRLGLWVLPGLSVDVYRLAVLP